MSQIVFKSTSQAKKSADTLRSVADSFIEFSEKMSTLEQKLANAWEGDSQDLSTATWDLRGLREDAVKISEALERLSLGVSSFAIAIENVGTGKGASGTTSFWESQKQNFKDDWDFSNCDGVLDYVGATVNGAISTVGSVGNFVFEGVDELLKWIF